jgi:hypothetical protein
MVCKACGHRWGSLLPPALCLTNAERPYRPAKVVRVHREVCDGIMYLPVFGETRRPADLVAVVVVSTKSEQVLGRRVSNQREA